MPACLAPVYSQAQSGPAPDRPRRIHSEPSTEGDRHQRPLHTDSTPSLFCAAAAGGLLLPERAGALPANRFPAPVPRVDGGPGALYCAGLSVKSWKPHGARGSWRPDQSIPFCPSSNRIPPPPPKDAYDWPSYRCVAGAGLSIGGRRVVADGCISPQIRFCDPGLAGAGLATGALCWRFW